MPRLLPSFLLVVPALAWACAGTAPLAPKAVELNRAGTAALAAGDLETAEARFALALEYHPRFVEALTNLGLVEMQRGNLALARLQFERARRINPDSAQPHHALGVLAERERRPDIAAEHYRDALKVNPGFGPSRANLGRILFAAGRSTKREQFLRLVEVDPGLLAGRTGLAETLLQLGRQARATPRRPGERRLRRIPGARHPVGEARVETGRAREGGSRAPSPDNEPRRQCASRLVLDRRYPADRRGSSRVPSKQPRRLSTSIATIR